MELYKITASCSNDSSTHEFFYLPENFEGVKIVQSFSFQNPIGYNPKGSSIPFRVAKFDRDYLDNIFNLYGLESSVLLAIEELNNDGLTYSSLFNFMVDFESYEVFDVYSEFGVKFISAIDDYNKVKNTEIQVPLTSTIEFPNTQKYINYVSLKSKDLKFSVFKFEKNNESKIYDDDISLYKDGVVAENVIYLLGASNLNKTVRVHFGISIKATLSNLPNNIVTIELIFLNANGGFLSQPLFIDTPIAGNLTVNQSSKFYMDVPVTVVPSWCILRISGGGLESTVVGDVFVDVKKETDITIFSEKQIFKYIVNKDLLNIIFNNKVVSVGNPLINNYCTTSENSLTKSEHTLNIKPKDFVNDICVLGGQVLNYKLNGDVQFKDIYSYFAGLFHPSNTPIEIVNFKDLSFKYSQDLLFSGVEVGQEAKTYDNYTYLIDWNKVLTFKQTNRNAKEILSLIPSKIRVDFSGMLDAVIKRSKQITKNLKDNYIFDGSFGFTIGTSPDIWLYDTFTPREILNRWKTFLSFAFQNFGKNTLTISSDGGTPDNLQVNGINQMDDLVLSELKKILPIEINFTCLMETVDFSEKLLKINYNNENIYIFVIESETTDTLREQKIKGLKVEL